MTERVAQHELSLHQSLGVGEQPCVRGERLVHVVLLGQRRREVVHARHAGEAGRLRDACLLDHRVHGQAHLREVEVELGRAVMAAQRRRHRADHDPGSRRGAARFDVERLAASPAGSSRGTRRRTARARTTRGRRCRARSSTRPANQSQSSMTGAPQGPGSTRSLSSLPGSSYALLPPKCSATGAGRRGAGGRRRRSAPRGRTCGSPSRGTRRSGAGRCCTGS